ncbi:MAG: hypothetical protein QXN71_03865 [Candidatus Aenigmatarchaeota archaeon]
MHIEIEPYEPSFTELKILVKEENNILGKYILHPYRPWNEWEKRRETYHYGGKEFYSYIPNKGIPRLLVKTACSLLQELSEKLYSEIIHIENFLTPKSRLKLPHIFRDLGYEIDFNCAFRSYFPKK